MIGAGEIMLFVSAGLFAVHILTIDFFVAKVDSVELSLRQFYVCGLVSMIPMMLFETPRLENLAAGWFPIFYTGVLSVGVAYTLQVVAQKNTDPTSASLILSLESVFSVVAAAFILQERMTGRELAGCVLMFAAIIASQLPERAENAEKAPEMETAADMKMKASARETVAETKIAARETAARTGKNAEAAARMGTGGK